MAAEPRYLTLRDNARVLEEHLEAFNEFENKTKQQKLIKNLKHKKTVEYTAAGKTYLVKMYKLETIGRKIKAFLTGSRARHEFEVSLELQRRGIPAVRVVAMKESGDPRWVACEKLEGWDQLQAVLLSDQTPAAVRRRLCFHYGTFARRLQDAGVWQYDFNPSNVLVRDGEMTLIDFERVEVRSRALEEGDRLYLLAKMNRIQRLSRTDRLRFLLGYVAAHAEERARLGSVVAEIARRAKLQEAADSERVEERCVSENRDFAPFEIGDATGHYLRVRPERPVAGVTLEELRAIIDGPGGQPAEDALEEWKRANRRTREGAAPPLAVILKKGERKGRIIFRS
jgi:tRNA A-37 threonylcarbamoyl transferase component Bud32